MWINFHCALPHSSGTCGPAEQYLHVMANNHLAGYKAINLVKDDYMCMVGVSINADMSRVLCIHQLIFTMLTWNKWLSIKTPFFYRWENWKNLSKHCDTVCRTSCFFQPIFLIQDNLNSSIIKHWERNMTLLLALQFLEHLQWAGADSSVWGCPGCGWDIWAGRESRHILTETATQQSGRQTAEDAMSHQHRAAKIIKPFWAVTCCFMLAYYSPSQGDFSSILKPLVTSATGKPD